MTFGNVFAPIDISTSGLAAERLRMEVVANNIANANSTRSAGGGAYRRRQVVFASMYDQFVTAGGRVKSDQLGGVKVMGVQEDQSELNRIYQPGHPDADPDGFVTLPNVKIPHEMVDLMTAGRAYEANLKVLRHFKEMAEQALSMLRVA